MVVSKTEVAVTKMPCFHAPAVPPEGAAVVMEPPKVAFCAVCESVNAVVATEPVTNTISPVPVLVDMVRAEVDPVPTLM